MRTPETRYVWQTMHIDEAPDIIKAGCVSAYAGAALIVGLVAGVQFVEGTWQLARNTLQDGIQDINPLEVAGVGLWAACLAWTKNTTLFVANRFTQ
jgi:hypothetical protein